MKITQNRSRILCNNNGYESASNKMHSYLKSGKYKDRIKLIDEVTPDSGYSPYYILMVYSPDMQPSGYIRYSKNKLVYQIYNSIGQASKVDTLKRCLSRFESAIEVFDDFDQYNNVNSASNILAGSAYTRIAKYGEFDNGHVMYGDWEDMPDVEAEELARKKSLQDPEGVYYVQYDDIMKSSSDYVWINGIQYDRSDVSYEYGKPHIHENANSATNTSNIMSPVGKVNSNTSKLNYTTPDMKNLKRTISRIIVDNDDQFIDLIDAILSGKPINEVSEVRALHRAIDQCVVDSDEQLRDLILQVAADIGVISESSYLNDKSIHSSTSTNSDSLVWM